MRVLTRQELTAALAARQFLLERRAITPAEAIRRLTPLQGQHPPAPHIALAARLQGFSQADLDAAIDARSVVKTTIMRMTLHLAAAEDFPAYAQLTRQARLRAWRNSPTGTSRCWPRRSRPDHPARAPAAAASVEEEALRTARFCAPEAAEHEVKWS